MVVGLVLLVRSVVEPIMAWLRPKAEKAVDPIFPLRELRLFPRRGFTLFFMI